MFNTPKFILLNDNTGPVIIPTDNIRYIRPQDRAEGSEIGFMATTSCRQRVRETVPEIMRRLVVWSE